LKKFYFLLLVLLFTNWAQAQYFTLTEDAEISIITIGPGAELYDKFGHSAFRIHDESQGIDFAYNYGVYDFDTPNFYTKFAQGKLLYKVIGTYYQPFFESYVAQNRWVKEQTLNLTYSEKQAIFDFLQNNAKPENMNYKYDFFFDNCATKIRDVLITVLGEKLQYNGDYITEENTFRELIQKNLKSNTWGSLGIDLGLGAVIDRKASPMEYQFLPEYVSESAAHATLTRNNTKEELVKNTAILYEAKQKDEARNFFLSPIFIFSVLGLFIIFITWKDLSNNTRSKYLDSVIFAVTSLIGIFLCLLWFATDHTATANNYNLLWAFPVSIIFIGLIAKKQPKHWLRKYVFFLIVMLLLLAIHWITGVQVFAIGILPLLVALAIRYIFLVFYLKRHQNTENLLPSKENNGA